MNEINKIHLGRQAFTISREAHKELEAYLDEISSLIKDIDVVDEIELRIAELLTERGINGDKVVLPKDIEYVEKQLGSPSDFKEDDGEETPTTYRKRLFRDIDNGIIGGVAAGLSNYLGIDVLLIRIVFIVVLIPTFGWGILVYVLLWLLVPEAKTPSEKLQMVGKPVNVRSLKQVVSDADIKGAARRANNAIADPINGFFRFIVKVVGIALAAFGLSCLLGLLTATTYYIARNQAWSKDNIFPIGASEHVLLGMAIGVTALIAVFIVIFGVAIFRRKWPIRTWITGVLVGLVFVGLAIVGALIADVYPAVKNAYNANTHQTIRSVKEFNSIDLEGNDLYNINFIPSHKYLVGFDYYGHPNLSKIITSVSKQTLFINTYNFKSTRDCATLCIPNNYNLSIDIYTPYANQLSNSYQPFYTPQTIKPPFPPN